MIGMRMRSHHDIYMINILTFEKWQNHARSHVGVLRANTTIDQKCSPIRIFKKNSIALTDIEEIDFKG